MHLRQSGNGETNVGKATQILRAHLKSPTTIHGIADIRL